MPNEDLLKEINTRLTAIGESVSEEKLKALVNAQLTALLGDQEFVRKMKFGAADDKLLGTKYARWNLSVEDIEFLYDLQESLKGQKRVNNGGVYEGPSEVLRNTFRAVSEAYYLPEEEVRKIDQKAIDDLFPKIPLAWFRGKDREYARRGAFELTDAYQRAMRGTTEMDTAQSGYGNQLIGAQYVADLWGAARAESRVFSLIDTFEMTAPTAYLPVEVDIPEMLFVAETASDLVYSTALLPLVKTGSQRVQVVAKKFIINQIWSGEMEEDSILPFVPFLRRQSMLSLAHYSDSLVLNGDTVTAGTGNINSDDGAPTSTKHYLAADGIRKVGLVDATGQSKDLAGPITLAALNDVPGRMVDYTYLQDWGHPTNPDQLVHICDPITGDKIGLMDEMIVWKQFQGKQLLNGQIGDILGRPIITSIALTKTDADGKYTTTTPATNDTKGQVVSFNRQGIKAGWRRRVRLETERLIGSDQTRMLHSLRLGLGRYTPTGAASGQKWADVIYDITL